MVRKTCDQSKILITTLKKKHRAHMGTWAEELPGVLWAYRTTVQTPTGEMPFALTYKSEAVIPVEVKMPMYYMQHFYPASNNERLAEELDLLEEMRKMVSIQTTSNKRKVEQYFNKRVRPRFFRVGDMLLKQMGVTTHKEGKLGLQWEGPYMVTTSNQPGSYHLKSSKGVKLRHPWNAEHLTKYFV